MRSKILAVMGFIMLAGLLTIGFFVFPIGISICAIIGLCYGYKKKDKPFVRWSAIALAIGIASVIYTLFVIHSM